MKKKYKLLKIKPTATKEEVQKAYRKLCLKHHPDVGGSEKKFKKINKAYNKIMQQFTNSYIYDTNTICIYDPPIQKENKKIGITDKLKELLEKENIILKKLNYTIVGDMVDVIAEINDFTIIFELREVRDTNLCNDIGFSYFLFDRIKMFLETHKGGRIYD